MLKRAALTVFLSFVFLPINGYCANGSELITLDNQRNELLKNLTTGLVSGKISIIDAQQIKSELDNVIKQETQLKEDPVLTPEHMQSISDSLQQAQAHIANAMHPTKVWLGIDSKDKTMEQKITDALQSGKITKGEAESLKQQFDELRARQSNGDPSHGFEFTDAMSLATDIQTLNSKIDSAVAANVNSAKK